MREDALAAAAMWEMLVPEVRQLFDAESLLPRLTLALQQARAEWPRLNVPPQRFGIYVAARVPDAPALEALLDSPSLAELYLACACHDGDAAAIATLERRYFPTVTGALMRMRLDRHAVDDVLQWLRGHLFLARPDGRRGIDGFRGGRGTLAAWLSVIAVREACRLSRRARRDGGDGDAELARLAGSERDVEKQYAQKWSRQQFQQAFVRALAELEDRDKSLLRLHYLDGVTLDRLAAIYRRDRATAVRWLAAARQRLLDRTRAALMAELRVPFTDCDSIIAAAREQLELTFQRLLASQGVGVKSIGP